jgi:hypothetical protein
MKVKISIGFFRLTHSTGFFFTLTRWNWVQPQFHQNKAETTAGEEVVKLEALCAVEGELK